MKRSRPGRLRLLFPALFVVPSVTLVVAPVAKAEDPVPSAPLAAPAAVAAPESTAALDDARDKIAELQKRQSLLEQTTAEATAHATAASDQLAASQGRLSALESRLALIDRLSLHGFVQGRYEWHDDASYGIENKTPRGTNRFYVSRGRVLATYDGDFSQLLLQIDATGDGVVLKDAEASLVLNQRNMNYGARPWELKVTLGQFKIPFGFEILQWSADREMPERIAVVRALFPGERDRGLRVAWTYDWLRLTGAVINGNFTVDPVHGTYDQSSWKDVVVRAQGVWGPFATGVSAHVGRFLEEVRTPSLGMPVAGYDHYSRLRLGWDAQGHVIVPGLGAIEARAELIFARDHQLSFGGVGPDPKHCKDANRFGWAGTLVQNVGAHFGLVARVDQYDPTAGLDDACTTPLVVNAAADDRVTDIGFGVAWLVSPNLNNTVSYQHLVEQGPAVGNDVVTVQMQARF